MMCTLHRRGLTVRHEPTQTYRCPVPDCSAFVTMEALHRLQEEASMAQPVIPARASSPCNECGGQIQPGDMIVPDRIGTWIHERCPDDSSADLKPGERVCPNCYLVHPEGACDRA